MRGGKRNFLATRGNPAIYTRPRFYTHDIMADETNESQTEGTPKKTPAPVNLAFIEAKERGISLEPAKAEKPAKPAKAAKPEPAPEPEAPKAPEPAAIAQAPAAEAVPVAEAAREQDAPPPDSDWLAEWTPPAGFGAQFQTRWITPTPRSPDLDRSKPASSLVWQRDRAGRPLDTLMLAALADLAPPRVIWKRDAISGSATVSMTTHFHATPEEMTAVGSRFILSEVHCRRCEGGYFDHELKLWSPDGALLATSEQVAAYRD